MPTYKFMDKNTGHEWVESMGISECDRYLEANPHVERLVNGAPMLGLHFNRQKPDQWFRDKMKVLKEEHPGHTIGKNTTDWG